MPNATFLHAPDIAATRLPVQVENSGRACSLAHLWLERDSAAATQSFVYISESSSDPLGFFRFSQVEAFVNDSWKVNSKLSLEMGVRYQFGTPIYTQSNNLANFDPALYNPAQAVTVLANGTIDTTKGGNRLNGLVRVGSRR